MSESLKMEVWDFDPLQLLQEKETDLLFFLAFQS